MSLLNKVSKKRRSLYSSVCIAGAKAFERANEWIHKHEIGIMTTNAAVGVVAGIGVTVAGIATKSAPLAVAGGGIAVGGFCFGIMSSGILEDATKAISKNLTLRASAASRV